ncbi:MAG: sugar phosphate isomerase/epimerase [Acidobacteria bacterium]|nr:sugar phosphate isomerase/epimerase [Acidobacteriota bacterium]
MSVFLTRRALLAGLPAGLLARQAGVRMGCQTNSWPIDPKKLSTFGAVLDRVKSFGFQGFETSFRNVQEHFQRPAEVRARIGKTGLRFLGVHIFLLEYDPKTRVASADLYRNVVDGAAPMGAERLIVSGATAAPGGMLDGAAVERKCAALNAAASYAKAQGLRFAYHNHGAEFAGAGAEIEAICAGTDPSLVHFMFDTGHARRANADVPAFFLKHHPRIDGLHLRDLSDRPGDNPALEPFDLRAVASAIGKAKWNGWLVVEEENAVGKSGDDAVRPAREALRAQFGF